VTITVTPTNTLTPTTSVTQTPTVTPSITSTITPTSSVTSTVTPTVTKTVTITPTTTPTPTITPTNTNTPTPTVTQTSTVTPSVTPSVTITSSITPTATNTPTVTPTTTITPSITATPVDFILQTIDMTNLNRPANNRTTDIPITINKVTDLLYAISSKTLQVYYNNNGNLQKLSTEIDLNIYLDSYIPMITIDETNNYCYIISNNQVLIKINLNSNNAVTNYNMIPAIANVYYMSYVTTYSWYESKQFIVDETSGYLYLLYKDANVVLKYNLTNSSRSIISGSTMVSTIGANNYYNSINAIIGSGGKSSYYKLLGQNDYPHNELIDPGTINRNNYYPLSMYESLAWMVINLSFGYNKKNIVYDTFSLRVASYSNINNYDNFLSIGDTYNPSDSTPNSMVYIGGDIGTVGYSYYINKFKVTVSDYVSFLNSVARTDAYDLYNYTTSYIFRSGSSGSYSYIAIVNGSYPIETSWYNWARYCNWLHNGKPNSGLQDWNSTEDGAYTLLGKINGYPISKKFDAKYHIPTLDEWHKAGFYDPSSSTSNKYWKYPTRNNSVPSSSKTDIFSSTFINSIVYDNKLNKILFLINKPENISYYSLEFPSYYYNNVHYQLVDETGNLILETDNFNRSITPNYYSAPLNLNSCSEIGTYFYRYDTTSIQLQNNNVIEYPSYPVTLPSDVVLSVDCETRYPYIISNTNKTFTDILKGRTLSFTYSPKYVAISSSSKRAYVSLDNASLAVIPISIFPTPTPTKTTTPTVTPTRTVTPSITPSITPTSSITPTTTPTKSVTPTITPTITVTPSVTVSISVTPTITPTSSITPSITTSVSVTPSPTQSVSVTPTSTVTPSITPSVTITSSITPSVTVTSSITPSVTPTTTKTPTITPTSSATPTVTPTISVTPSITPTITLTPTKTPTPTQTSVPDIRIFNIANSSGNVEVPVGITIAEVWVIGAGGGGYYNSGDSEDYGFGGFGGETYKVFSVTAGTSLSYIIGKGGLSGDIATQTQYNTLISPDNQATNTSLTYGSLLLVSTPGQTLNGSNGSGSSNGDYFRTFYVNGVLDFRNRLSTLAIKGYSTYTDGIPFSTLTAGMGGRANSIAITRQADPGAVIIYFK